MDIYDIRVNTHLAAVYFNNGNPNLFRIHVDVTLADLKQQLDQLNRHLNGHRDTRRVTHIEYRRPSVMEDGRVVSFTNMVLRTDEDVRSMFSIFSQYSTKGPIELDAKLVRSVTDILTSLNRPRTYDEIATLMVEPEEYEVVNLADP
jgi:hypothetical protein